MARRSITGDIRLRRVLRRISQTADNQIRPAMQKAADLVLETQQELIPVDTGEGKAALEAFVSKSGLDAQIGIRGKKKGRRFFYLRFVENGTKGNEDQPALPARPFIRPSYDLNRDAIKKLLKEAIDETLSKASQGVSDG